MTADSPSTAAGRPWWRRVLAVSAEGALLGAYAEIGLRYFGRPFAHHILAFNPFSVWMAPLANFVLLVPLVAIVDAVAVRLRGPVVAEQATRTVAYAAAAYEALFLFDRLHTWALLLLVVGVGYQAARLTTGRPLGRWSARVAVALAAVAVCGAAIFPIARRGRFDRTVSALSLPPSAAPNVLLLILDTVRASDLGAYGYARPTTPVLDSLANEGVLFTRAFSAAPWTLPSHASMFTGRDAFELSARYRAALDSRFPVAAEAFTRAGWVTGGFVANLWYCTRESGLARGFAWYVDWFVSPAAAFATTRLGQPLAKLVRRVRGRPFLPQFKSASVVNDEFLRWHDRLGHRPYFAFLNYIDAHTPYAPSRTHERDFLAQGDTLVFEQDGLKPSDAPALRGARAAHDAAVREVDRAIGDLLAQLRQRGDLDRTIVAVVADHGEEFGEHGVLEHGNSLYLNSLHVPLIILRPGAAPAGTRVDVPVSTKNLAATLLSLAGAPPNGVSGSSLATTWTAPGTPGPDSLVLSWTEQTFGQLPHFPASKSELHSIIADSAHFIHGAEDMLFDYAADPGEARDLIAEPGWQLTLERLRRVLRLN